MRIRTHEKVNSGINTCSDALLYKFLYSNRRTDRDTILADPSADRPEASFNKTLIEDLFIWRDRYRRDWKVSKVILEAWAQPLYHDLGYLQGQKIFVQQAPTQWAVLSGKHFCEKQTGKPPRIHHYESYQEKECERKSETVVGKAERITKTWGKDWPKPKGLSNPPAMRAPAAIARSPRHFWRSCCTSATGWMSFQSPLR